MVNNLYNILLFTGIIFYAFFGFSPITPHIMTADMMDSHTEMMAMEGHTMAMGDCTDTACVQAAADDCLEHCLQAAAAQTTDKTILITVSFFIAIVAAIIAIIPVLERVFTFRRRHWFRPLYLFNTVRLLE